MWYQDLTFPYSPAVPTPPLSIIVEDDDPVGTNGHLGKARLDLEALEPGLRKQRIFSEWLPLTTDGFVEVADDSGGEDRDRSFRTHSDTYAPILRSNVSSLRTFTRIPR